MSTEINTPDIRRALAEANNEVTAKKIMPRLLELTGFGFLIAAAFKGDIYLAIPAAALHFFSAAKVEQIESFTQLSKKLGRRRLVSDLALSAGLIVVASGVYIEGRNAAALTAPARDIQAMPAAPDTIISAPARKYYCHGGNYSVPLPKGKSLNCD